MTGAPSADEESEALVAWLESTRLAGAVATDRSSNRGNIRRLVAGDPGYSFGVPLAARWDEGEVLGLMARRAGISPDPGVESGQDTIDARLTAARLLAFGDRLGESIARREPLLFATGHPAALLVVHAALAALAAENGCRVLGVDDTLATPTSSLPSVPGGDGGEIRQLFGVHMRYRDGNLLHTHLPDFAELLLDRLAERDLVPGLVIADHGWAGAAGARGIPAIGMADCNDPALFVAEADGLVDVVVPIDDGLRGAVYGPVIEAVRRRVRARVERGPSLPC